MQRLFCKTGPEKKPVERNGPETGDLQSFRRREIGRPPKTTFGNQHRSTHNSFRRVFWLAGEITPEH